MSITLVNEGERILYRCNGKKSCNTSPGCGITHPGSFIATCTETFDPAYANPMYVPKVIKMDGKVGIPNEMS